MESYVFDEVLDFSEESYFLKTLNSEPQKRIISSVFRAGLLVYSRSEAYNGHLSDEQLYERVKQYHEGSKSGIRALFTLSKKYADSTDVGKRLLLVRAFIRHGMFKEATQEIANILRIYPSLSKAYFYMGQIRMEIKEFDQAVKCFAKAIEIDPNFADYHFWLGRACLQLQECRNAINEFIQAIKINSYYSEAYYHLGLAYIKNALIREDYALAKETRERTQTCLEKAVQIHPNFKNEHFVRGETCLEQGNLEEAYDCFLKALGAGILSMQHDFILDFYVRYLGADGKLSLKEISAYIERLRVHIKKFTHYADLYHELGIAYVILSRSINDNAIESFQKALSINPNYFEAQEMLKRIQKDQNKII